MRPSDRDRRFIAYLERLAGGGDHGRQAGSPSSRARADLASELGKPPGTCVRSLRWLACWTAHVSPGERVRHHLVAALFAAYQASASSTAAPLRGNLGLTTARLARARGGTTPSLERRFVALLEADAEEVGHHLRGLVGLARAADVPLDWAQLLADLRRWEDPLRRVQAEWARGFWAHGVAGTEPADACACADACVREEMGDAGGTAPAAELCAFLPEPG